jgi:hypothetical protein
VTLEMHFSRRSPPRGSVRHLQELLSIQDEWRELHGDSAWKTPFLSFAFIRLWYDCFAAPDQVRIYRVKDGKSTIGFLPMVLRRRSQLRTLESLTNDHCFHSEPLVRRGCEDRFPAMLLKEIYEDRNGWDVFRHRFSYSFSRFPGLFGDDLLACSGLSWRRRRQPTYSILLKRPFRDYYHGDLTRGSRKLFRKYGNRIAREGEVGYRYCQGAEAVKAWPDFLRIEDSGWKGGAGTSINRIAPNFKRYYQGLVELLADQEALHLHFLELDGEPVAGELCYTEGDVFHAFKTGYDERFKECSPGNFLLMHVIEHVTTSRPRTRRFHMFPWGYGHKQRYVNERSFCFETWIYSKTMRGRTARLFAEAKRAVKRAARKSSDAEETGVSERQEDNGWFGTRRR